MTEASSFVAGPMLLGLLLRCCDIFRLSNIEILTKCVMIVKQHDWVLFVRS